MTPFQVFLVIVAIAFAASQWMRRLRLQRLEYIRRLELPRGLFDRLRKRRPSLTLKDCQLVAHALRQFFLTHALSGRRFVSMPSQVTDDLWHEFILFTRNYESFCAKAFGRFLHHTPAVALGGDRQINAGLRRCWWHACRDENINPRAPTRLPLLFAIDAKLGIEDGFRYSTDGKALTRTASSGSGSSYRVEDFGDASIDGTTDGFGDGSSDGGGDGGCGGGGCGGGGD